MASSYRTRSLVSSNSDNISTRLRSYCTTQDNYTTRFFGRSLDVVVTREPAAVTSWIDSTLYIHRHRLNFHRGQNFIAGLGIQWCSFQSNNRPATLQICIGHRVLIFQIFQSRTIPDALSCLLSDSRITFVGYNIGYDCRLLRSYHDLVISSSAELRSVSGMGNASMEKMVETILGFPGVKKPWRIATSDWEAPQLSIDQVHYAALDAFTSFELGLELVAGPVLPNRESGLNECFELDGVSDGESSLRYSEEGSDINSGRGFKYGSDSSSSPGYSEEDGLNTHSGRGFEWGSDSSSDRRYSEEYGSDSYPGDSGSIEDEDAW
ncbi:hypothetical protein LUZ63_013965 [Rhynchospora breviuscula]|uniref:3'-5' exonuclease domain-containing protein n=1 Tax=Rhynchospora breviuscula TaxID=2022672 RepID=A0A9Q0C9T3_9POAL|nr:hypothetical protein LUZ63_013965 [Rhynchospora breviuscula]